MNKNIAIIGCGWLGLPLAKKFIEKEYTVNGSTTSEDKLSTLAAAGIKPFLISLTETNINGDINSFLDHADVLIINVPPKLRGENKENYVQKMRLILKSLRSSTVKKVVFVSSTSVYGDMDGEVTEETTPQPSTESGRQLLECEQLFQNESGLETTIIRFGGLIGPNRNPVTMLSKKKNLKNGNAPINLIHLNDCIRVIFKSVHENWGPELLNAVFPYHPSKKKYYTLQALKQRLQPPEYDNDIAKKGKLIRSYTLTNVKKFEFTTPL
ncbi:SDR family oxidoreductase [Zobellia amurskyensis]|uniref:SDR family oxidoreductase n=1 Tax=Zobellia amurskyensis TaxID=248905 RepID=A0A7X2ZS72_9FLAO|nr:SDR family oxidoreductase [Zobellia amurskyensis]MUH35402.1 SDR family oxidoreductase [Zobellia amurskyensis]